MNNLKKVRIDKWLWAARFYKTRSLAKQAIEGGKVRIEGQRVKASRDINLGETLVLRQGWDDREVLVTGLSEQRRGAVEAASLYQETQRSLAERERKAAQRKLAGALNAAPEGKPDRKQRRQIHQFVNSLGKES